jgi:hypothetical protein
MFENDIQCSSTIFGMAMFDNMLDNPVSPLTARDGIDIGENLFNAGTL